MRTQPRRPPGPAGVAHGDTNKQIARELSIALPTVKNHIHKVLENLELRSRRDAAAYVRRCGAALPG